MTRRTVLLTTTALAALVALGLASAFAGPDGANVVGGSATVQGQGTATVTVNQSSERAIINWRQFDIGVGETTRFNQPSSSSVALNRVTGGLGPTQILGTLDANGRVFVINRDGILIGPRAKIDTAGFLATTNDIRDDDFMAGRYNFNIPGRPDASVVNHGTITAHSAGFAALVAPGVRNTGTITATLGTVGLASGNSFTLDFYGDRLITLAVGDSIGTTVRDVNTGQPLNSLVENVGRIQANGGRVELTAAEARRVVDSVINNRGVVEANTVGTRGGTIVLGAATRRAPDSPRQVVRVGGTLSASAPKGTKGAKIKDGSGEGGRVVVTGEHIVVANARIDVSGPARGGTVLIGGDWAGGNPNTSAVSHPNARLESNAIPTAATVSVDASTVIDASATDNGNAGKVIVWADGATSFRGNILATGGQYGGDGGFVEVSGHQFLDYRGTVDTRAPRGTTGTLLLDPWNVTIMLTASTNGSFSGGVWTPTGPSVLSPVDLQNQLLTSNVVVTTNGSGPDPGNISVASNVTWANNNSLTLSAHNNVTFQDNVTVSNTGGGNFIVRADNDGVGGGTISFNQATFGSRVNWTGSTGNVSFYYNPTSYTAPTDFTPSGQIGGGTRGVTTANANQFTPYMLVNSGADLQNISTNLGGTYALGTNINAAVGFNGFGPFTTFTGTLDGHGGLGVNHTISNITLTSASTSAGIGMFPFIGAGGVVRNLNLDAVNLTAGNNTQTIGAVAGESAGTISNVTVSGTISNPNNFGGIVAGGVVGRNTSNTTVTQSTSSVTVNVGSAASLNQLNTGGGLVGSNQGTITNSSSSGVVSGGANTIVGGLAGQNGLTGPNPAIGTINNSFANGNVTISGLMSFAGGLVGSNAPGSTITNGRAFGNVTSTANGTTQNEITSVGGLVGQNAGTITSPTTPPSSATACSGGQSCATGIVTVGAHGQGGGLVGFNMGTIANSFALGVVTTPVDGAGDSANTHLGGLAGASQGTITNSFATGNVGDPNNPRAFVMAGGLVSDNAGTITNSFARGNVVVGDNSQAGGLVASNSPFDNCQNCPGPFGDGQNNNATITNSQASGNVTGGSASVVGGFAGGGSSGTFNNVSASGAVTGGDNSLVGGLVAALDFGGVITQSSATGPVSSTGQFSMVGGLVALNVGTISSSTSSGAVSATDFSFVGGLVGINLGSITQSTTTASATVTAPGIGNLVGGLVGANAGTIQQNSNAAGAVTGGMLNAVGGLVGANIALSGPNLPPGNPIPGSSFPVGTITDSVATGNVSGGTLSFIGGQVGANGAVLNNLTSANNVSGGDGSIVGGLVGLNSGPLLFPLLPAILAGCDSPACQALQSAQPSTGPGTITHGSSTSTVTGGAGSFVGGLVGWNLFGGISESSASGPVTGGDGSVAGGLVALNFGSIGTSSSTGPVTVGAGGIAGGLVGLNLGGGGSAAVAGLQASPGSAQAFETGTIRQSFSTSTVTGGAGSTVAGLVAANGGLLDQTYAIGVVQGGASSTTGGLVAINSGAFTIPPEFGGGSQLPTQGGTVTNSYWDPGTTQQQSSAAGQPFPNQPGLPPGFDPNVWTFQPTTYPCFAGVDCTPRTLTPFTPDQPTDPTVPCSLTLPCSDLLPPSNSLVVANLTQTTDTNPTQPGEVVNTTQTTQTQNNPRGNQRPQGNQQTNNGPLRPDGRPSNVPPLNETRFINNQVVVQIGAGISPDVLNRVARRLGLSVLASETLGLLGTRVIQFQIGSGRSVRDVIIELEKQRVIDEATPNYEFMLAQDATSQAPAGDPAQYTIAKLNLAEAHRIATGENVLIAVIDSEIDAKHPDLEGRIANRFDAVGPADKPHPHGTGMAGAIASHRKLMGTAPGARILAIRAFGSGSGGAQGTTMQIVKGLDWAISQGAKVVNMSFAGPKDPTLAKAFAAANARKVVLIAAAGNAGPKSPPLYPGAETGVIAVSATDADDAVYVNANRGKYVTVAAPGVDILVPAPDGNYEFTTGTSVAAAHVSGVAALLLQRDPKLDPAAVREILTSTAKQLGKTQGGRNDETGHGLVDPLKALQSLGARSAAVTTPATVGVAAR